MILPNVSVKKILYATDLSENARYAFAYAVSLANLYGASITILHVIAEDARLDDRIIGYVGEERWAEIKDRNVREARQALIGKKRENVGIKEALYHFSENAKASFEDQSFVTDEILVEKGDPSEQILKQVKARNCDLIVMGTYGHGILADAMMGSTARRVVRRSSVPVLIVRIPE